MAPDCIVAFSFSFSFALVHSKAGRTRARQGIARQARQDKAESRTPPKARLPIHLLKSSTRQTRFALRCDALRCAALLVPRRPSGPTSSACECVAKWLFGLSKQPSITANNAQTKPNPNPTQAGCLSQPTNTQQTDGCLLDCMTACLRASFAFALPCPRRARRMRRRHNGTQAYFLDGRQPG